MQHFINHNNHHYKLSINPHRVGVFLLEKKDLKESWLYLLLGLPSIILIMKRTLRKKLY